MDKKYCDASTTPLPNRRDEGEKVSFEKSNLNDVEFQQLNLLRPVLPRLPQPTPQTLQKVTE